MHSKYLKCDKCENIIDRRDKNDFDGRYANTQSRGTFAPNETAYLLTYAKTLEWAISQDIHICPNCHV